MMLKLGHVYSAAEMVTKIINENRPLPQKGSYRLARLYAKLKPEYDMIVARRNAMIEAYDHHEVTKTTEMVDGVEIEHTTTAEQLSVPLDKMSEFTAAWADVCADEIEVAVEPIPLSQLSVTDEAVGAISAGELIVLGDLVAG